MTAELQIIFLVEELQTCIAFIIFNQFHLIKELKKMQTLVL